jgi:Domain of unknown function (DUF4333)
MRGTMATHRTSRWMPFVLAIPTLVTACAGAVPAAQVTDSIDEQLRNNGITATDITCPTDLTAVEDTSVTCSFRVDAQIVDAVVSVQSVVGDQAQFVVTPRARPVEEGSLEQSLAADLAEKTRRATPDVDCPDDLAPVVGTSILCDIGDGGRSARVSVSEVSGGAVKYDVVVG